MQIVEFLRYFLFPPYVKGRYGIEQKELDTIGIKKLIKLQKGQILSLGDRSYESQQGDHSGQLPYMLQV